MPQAGSRDAKGEDSTRGDVSLCRETQPVTLSGQPGAVDSAEDEMGGEFLQSKLPTRSVAELLLELPQDNPEFERFSIDCRSIDL